MIYVKLINCHVNYRSYRLTWREINTFWFISWWAGWISFNGLVNNNCSHEEPSPKRQLGKICDRKEYETTIPCPAASTTNEPRHDKTNKMGVRPAKTQISLGIRPVRSEISLSAWRNLGSLANHWAHSEDSGGCPGWSESLLGTVILLVLSWGGSYFS